ncbi:MAG: hypothetical protein ACE5F9_01780 [Phycisphaerae bacterium]
MPVPDRQHRRSCAARPAFTLAEALLAATILAVVAASATLPFISGTQQMQASARLEQATALGQALMEEILARPFFAQTERLAAPGPGPGEKTRTLFKNIDDFHGLTESAANVRNYQNTLITDAGVSDLWRTASVQYVTFPDQDAADVDSFVHIHVTVFDGTDPIVTLDRIAARED